MARKRGRKKGVPLMSRRILWKMAIRRRSGRGLKPYEEMRPIIYYIWDNEKVGIRIQVAHVTVPPSCGCLSVAHFFVEFM